MSKNLHYITTQLGLILLVVISWNIAYAGFTAVQPLVNIAEPTYQSEHTTTIVYNPVGGLQYKLIADYVNHYAEQQITWFTRPSITTFDEDKVPIWMAKADKAKLTKGRILYLYGHVQVNNLSTDTAYLKRITTDNATINLITQDIFSNNKVTLYGTGFNSTGMKMRGNLRNKTVELIENVKTYYEISKLQCIR